VTEILPNETERRIAYELERRADRNGIAYALAEARAGRTIEGERVTVSHHVEMSARYAGQPIALERMRVQLWRALVSKLVEQELRPTAWPAESRTFWRFALAAPDHPGLVECDADARWDRMRISLDCEAVPS